MVERLLASPRYGERWGRHWLDVARYADSNGLDENIAHPNAFRYRDWVIEAFNTDKPYDRFVQEQIAGDLLPAAGDDERFASLAATGFLTLGAKVLAEQDVDKMVIDIVDEQVNVIGRSFLAEPVGCARCHDHKFDPIPTADYYALAGILRSTRTMVGENRVGRWVERPLADEETVARYEAAQERVEEAQQAVDDSRRRAERAAAAAAAAGAGRLSSRGGGSLPGVGRRRGEPEPQAARRSPANRRSRRPRGGGDRALGPGLLPLSRRAPGAGRRAQPERGLPDLERLRGGAAGTLSRKSPTSCGR